jgi:hypothetical protein
MRILRGLSSKNLPCGCVAGVYETYHGLIVTIIDAKGTDCDAQTHREGKVVPEESRDGSTTRHSIPSRERSLGRE